MALLPFLMVRPLDIRAVPARFASEFRRRVLLVSEFVRGYLQPFESILDPLAACIIIGMSAQEIIGFQLPAFGGMFDPLVESVIVKGSDRIEYGCS